MAIIISWNVLLSVNRKMKIHRQLPRAVLHFLIIYFYTRSNRGGKLKIKFYICLTRVRLELSGRKLESVLQCLLQMKFSVPITSSIGRMGALRTLCTSTFSFSHSGNLESYCNKIISFCAAVTWHIECYIERFVCILEDEKQTEALDELRKKWTLIHVVVKYLKENWSINKVEAGCYFEWDKYVSYLR